MDFGFGIFVLNPGQNEVASCSHESEIGQLSAFTQTTSNMGLNYYMVISTLFKFRNRLDEFSTQRNQSIIDYFKAGQDDPYDEDAQVPKLKEIAKATGIPVSKVNPMVKDLYFNLVASFYDKPIEVTKNVVTILICIPWDEEQKPEGKRRYEQHIDEKQLQIDITLPYIPRIGEQISLQFIENSSRYSSGHVYNISHEITGAQQRIIIWVHPYHNYYHEWMKLKRRYEDHERWTKQIQADIQNREFKKNVGEKKSKERQFVKK